MSIDKIKEMRLGYTQEQKRFLNQKSYEIFEKYQIAILLYASYILAIMLASGKGELDKKIANSLVSMSTYFLLVFVSVFIVFIAINIITWMKYEAEENAILGQEKAIRKRDVFKWIEFWILLIGIVEVVIVWNIVLETMKIFSN